MIIHDFMANFIMHVKGTKRASRKTNSVVISK